MTAPDSPEPSSRLSPNASWPEATPLFPERDDSGALRPLAPEPSFDTLGTPLVEPGGTTPSEPGGTTPFEPGDTRQLDPVGAGPGPTAGDPRRSWARSCIGSLLSGIYLVVLVVLAAVVVATLVGTALLLLTMALRAAVT